MAFPDYEEAGIDSVQVAEILEAIRKQSVVMVCCKIVEDIYINGTAIRSMQNLTISQKTVYSLPRGNMKDIK